MKTRRMRSAITVLIISLALFACKKDQNPSPGGGSRTVKYELIGSYSGTITVIYTNAGGVSQLVDQVSLPWSVELTVGGSSMQPVALAASADVGGEGLPGETLTGKLSVGGQVKKTATVNSTSSGYIDLTALTHVLGQ